MRFLKLSVIFSAIFIAIIFSYKVSTLPDNINMTVGNSESLEIDQPFSMSLCNRNEPVISISQKQKPINSIEINAVKTGNTNIQFHIFGLPVKAVKVNVRPQQSLCAVGKAVGICIDTKGVLVLGTGKVHSIENIYAEPAKDKLYPGDVIVSANGVEIKNKEALINTVAKSDSTVKMQIIRNDDTINTTLYAVKSKEDNKNKIGVWVRDSTQGVGTLTYLDKNTGTFGALGHPIMDVDTGKLMSVSSGELLKTNIIAIEKGKRNVPGAIIGDTDFDKSLGQITENNSCGIYGKIKNINDFQGITLPVAYKGEVKTGPAYILANVKGDEIKQYSINIDSVNKYNANTSKGLVISVNDSQLINQTGGIVQGMSGCPIIQNGKIIGAVTHVFIKDSKRGYGIYIEDMLENSNAID